MLCGRLPIVSLFAVLREIQTLRFLLLRNSKADGHVDDLEDDEGTYNRKDPRDDNSY
jgi:hypothetical protein